MATEEFEGEVGPHGGGLTGAVSDWVNDHIRTVLLGPSLVALFRWDEATFLARTEGSAIRRLGHERWLRNIAVALGNAPTRDAVVAALSERAAHPSALVREHVHWALARHDQPVPEVSADG